MDEWANIAFGSIYHALKRMTQEGLVRPEVTERNGNRPSRTVFGITDPGREEFLRLLREAWTTPAMSPELMRTCLLFMQELPLDEVKDHLEYRAGVLIQNIEHVTQRVDQVSARGAPWTVDYILSYDIGQWQTALRWTEGLLEDIRSGKVTWTHAGPEAHISREPPTAIEIPSV